MSYCGNKDSLYFGVLGNCAPNWLPPELTPQIAWPTVPTVTGQTVVPSGNIDCGMFGVRIHIRVIRIDVRTGEVYREPVAHDRLQLDLGALDLRVACVGVHRRDALLDVELDAVVIRIEERRVDTQVLLEPRRFQTQLPRLGVLGRKLRLGALVMGADKASRPAARLEALAPAQVRHDIAVDVILRAERGVENVPGLAVVARREIAQRSAADREVVEVSLATDEFFLDIGINGRRR